jgi:hypothetical protein
LVVREKFFNLPAQLGLAGTFAVKVDGPVDNGKLTGKGKDFREPARRFGEHDAE